MSNNFLALGALIAFGWVFTNALRSEPTSRVATLRATTTEPAITSYVIFNRNVLEARRAPVPLVRNIRPMPATQTAPEAPVPDPEVQAQDDLDRSGQGGGGGGWIQARVGAGQGEQRHVAGKSLQGHDRKGVAQAR